MNRIEEIRPDKARAGICPSCNNKTLFTRHPAPGRLIAVCPVCLYTSDVSPTEKLTDEGVKHDSGKPRFELLAPEALEGTARILTFGATKYADRNWEKGMKWSRVFGALMRHLWAWWRGQHADPETGESHLHHAACCIMFLQAYEAREIGEDDRHKTEGVK